jgi:hypothetical protein
VHSNVTRHREAGADLNSLQLSKTFLDTAAACLLCWLKWTAVCTSSVLSLMHACPCHFKRCRGIFLVSLELVPLDLYVLSPVNGVLGGHRGATGFLTRCTARHAQSAWPGNCSGASHKPVTSSGTALQSDALTFQQPSMLNESTQDRQAR